MERREKLKMGTTIRPELSEKNPYWIERHRYYESSSEGNDVESDWNGGSWCGITHHR